MVCKQEAELCHSPSTVRSGLTHGRSTCSLDYAEHQLVSTQLDQRLEALSKAATLLSKIQGRQDLSSLQTEIQALQEAVLAASAPANLTSETATSDTAETLKLDQAAMDRAAADVMAAATQEGGLRSEKEGDKRKQCT